MNRKNIYQFINFKKLRLVKLHVKTIKYKKKATDFAVLLNWEYKIEKLSKEDLVITVFEKIIAENLYEQKYEFRVEYELMNEITESDVDEYIDDILIYLTTKNTLLSGLISSYMVDIPFLVAPYVKKEEIKKIV